jgi:hypothetical protein
MFGMAALHQNRGPEASHANGFIQVNFAGRACVRSPLRPEVDDGRENEVLVVALSPIVLPVSKLSKCIWPHSRQHTGV